MPRRRSSSAWVWALWGSGSPCGRDHRPEWVSCNPTTRSSVDPCASAWASTSPVRSPASASVVASSLTSWWGLARPSGCTATASPPQISLAPLSPKRRQRRATRSVGAPSVVPSQPSIGNAQNRLPTYQLPGGGVAHRERVGQRSPRLDLDIDADQVVDAQLAQPVGELVDARQPLDLFDVNHQSPVRCRDPPLLQQAMYLRRCDASGVVQRHGRAGGLGPERTHPPTT
jgi:hypothetical protein